MGSGAGDQSQVPVQLPPHARQLQEQSSYGTFPSGHSADDHAGEKGRNESSRGACVRAQPPHAASNASRSYVQGVSPRPNDASKMTIAHGYARALAAAFPHTAARACRMAGPETVDGPGGPAASGMTAPVTAALPVPPQR